jgi:serine O-acetyltransferase
MHTLKEYYHAEIIMGQEKKYSWRKVFRRARRSKTKNFIFWYRMAYVLARKNNQSLKSLSNSINLMLSKRYSIQIMTGANIELGLSIPHVIGICITDKCDIGKNFTIRQNTTIGTDFKSDKRIKIGDNVHIGANSCIIGSDLEIGDNVTIGAMSFINKNIPSNSTVLTKKEMVFTK